MGRCEVEVFCFVLSSIISEDFTFGLGPCRLDWLELLYLAAAL